MFASRQVFVRIHAISSISFSSASLSLPMPGLHQPPPEWAQLPLWCFHSELHWSCTSNKLEPSFRTKICHSPMGRPSSDFLICMDRFTKAKFIMIASEYFMTCSFPTSLQFWNLPGYFKVRAFAYPKSLARMYLSVLFAWLRLSYPFDFSSKVCS